MLIAAAGCLGLAGGQETGVAPEFRLLAASQGFGSNPTANGSDVTVADMDGDGDADLVHLPGGSTKLSTDPHGYWMENLGGRNFAPLRMMHVAPTGPGQVLGGATVVNLTGDARPEIFVVRMLADFREEPLVLTPSLDGTPLAEVPLAVQALALPDDDVEWQALDLDGDGQAELVELEMQEDDGTVQVRIRDRQADGSFAQTALLVTEDFPHDRPMEAVDLDGDGDRELTVQGGGEMRVFERTGARGFKAEPVVIPNLDSRGSWVDLDGDGLLDLSLVGGFRVLNGGALGFGAREVLPVWEWLGFAYLELVVPRPGQAALLHAVLSPGSGRLEMLTVAADAGVEEALAWHEVPQPASAFHALADLDGDGAVDLVYSHPPDQDAYYASRITAVAWGSAAGFSAPQAVHAGPAGDRSGGGPGVMAADFNRDKAADLITGPDQLGRYRLHFNRGAAGPDGGLPIEGLELTGSTMRIVGMGRIDRDKVVDLLVCYTKDRPAGSAEAAQTALVVVRGRKDGSFVKPVFPSGGPQFAAGGIVGGELVDWDRDGDLDLVGSGQWRENVKGAFPPGTRMLVEMAQMVDFLGNPTSIGETVTGDLDGDKRLDIISMVYGTSSNNMPPKQMLIGYGDGRGGIAATVVLPYQLAGWDFLGNPIMAGRAAIADLNGDKLPDLWIRRITGVDDSGLGNVKTEDLWLRNPGRRSRDVAAWEWEEFGAGRAVGPGSPLADFDGDKKLEWVSLSGPMKATPAGPVFSDMSYDFTGGIDFSTMPLRAAVDVDADGDVDFITGGENRPLLVVGNPLGDGGKKRVKVKMPKWVGKGLGVVR